MSGIDGKTCEYAARPFDQENPGVGGAPAEKVIYDPLLGSKDGKPWPFYACAKHFTAMAE